MGFDKAWLKYGDSPQWQVVKRLLEQVCARVLVSVRPEQLQPDGIEVIPDTREAGPLGGVLSAFQRNPEAAWLVVAVDMPFLSEKSLEYLVSRRDISRIATAFLASDGLPEPLVTIFEPSGFSLLLDFYNRNHLSLRKFLLNAEAKLLQPVAPDELTSIDTPGQYRQATE